jgi:NTE family protein
MPLVAPVQLDPLRISLNRFSAATAATFGVPGFFVPRQPPAFLAPDGTPDALSVYDTSPLKETLQELVDFDLLNRKGVRLSVGAVDVRTGNSVYFDNLDLTLGPEHVMASGSLPPGFPPTLIDGAHYWDGGLVSNSPLMYVFDVSPQIKALIVQVDLFSATGELPTNLDQVLERAKDIQYSSKTRLNTKQVQELERLRLAVGRLLRKLPATLRLRELWRRRHGPGDRHVELMRSLPGFLLASAPGTWPLHRMEENSTSPAGAPTRSR